MDIFSIANDLDKRKKYLATDALIKIALDVSFLGNIEPIAEGAFGAYKSNFDQNTLRKLKNNLGQIPPEIGIKNYHGFRSNDRNEFIQENLALIYFAPEINKRTDLKAPSASGILSLSGILAHNLIPTQHMKGIHIDKPIIKISETDRYDIIDETRRMIENKLQNIGIIWMDAHSGNYLVDESQIKKFIKEKQEAEINEQPVYVNYDLSSGASIVDFGQMSCSRKSAAATNLLKLKETLSKYNDNTLINSIINVINIMII